MREQTKIDFNGARFDGATYCPAEDQVRLSGQLGEIYRLMSDGRWRTIDELHDELGYRHTSIEAQLRNLRKKENGACDVPRRNRDGVRGLSEYRVVPPKHPLLVEPAA